jgi:hypothetical protein
LVLVPGLGVHRADVGLAVAVVVDVVADLRRRGVHRPGGVVALLAGREAVAVAVGEAAGAVAVVVRGVEAVVLDGAGVDRRVAVVTVLSLAWCSPRGRSQASTV